MIYDICEILKNKLLGRPYVDKIAGLVQAVKSKDEKGLVVYPVACEVIGKVCADQNNRLSDLVPDDRKKTVIYFEDISGINLISRQRNEFRFRARPRLVCWLNQKKLGKNQCSVTPVIIADIIKHINQLNFNDGVYLKIQIETIGEVAKSPAIFSRYTYREEEQQYLMYPFDYFALDISVEFSVNSNCIDDFVLGIEDNCNDI